MPPADDVTVRADPFRVSQVVGNIVGNALKFTPDHGSVTMRAEASGNHVTIHFRDTGPGVSLVHAPEGDGDRSCLTPVAADGYSCNTMSAPRFVEGEIRVVGHRWSPDHRSERR